MNNILYEMMITNFKSFILTHSYEMQYKEYKKSNRQKQLTPKEIDTLRDYEEMIKSGIVDRFVPIGAFHVSHVLSILLCGTKEKILYDIIGIKIDKEQYEIKVAEEKEKRNKKMNDEIEKLKAQIKKIEEAKNNEDGETND